MPTLGEEAEPAKTRQGSISWIEVGKGQYLDEDGKLTSADKMRFHSQVIIMEMMVLANTAIANWLSERDIPALYRNHTAKTIAPGQDKILEALRVLGSEKAIRDRLTQYLNRAEYSSSLVGHFALNLGAYTHFTSPIRRLADLINHRIIKAELRGEASPYSKKELDTLAAHINETVREDDRRSEAHHKAKAKAMIQSQIESGRTSRN